MTEWHTQCVTQEHDHVPRVVQGKGKNAKKLVFVRDLAKGELVVAEQAYVTDTSYNLLLAKRNKEHEEWHHSRSIWSLVQEALKNLPRDKVDALLNAGCAEVPPMWEKEEDERVVGIMDYFYGDVARIQKLYSIFNANATVCAVTDMPVVTLEQNVLAPIRHGFFPLLSRANHACTPSAYIAPEYWKPGTPLPTAVEVGVITTRDVKAGEELTVDYVGNVTRAEKRKALVRGFHFHCRCAECEPLCALWSCDKPKGLACGQCLQIRYCSKEHQKEDWRAHKPLCTGSKKV